VSIADGDTLFVVNWTANTDTDTAGYDLFMDPIPGQESLDASTDATIFHAPQTVCQTTTVPVSSDAGDASDGASSDAAAESGTTTLVDAGCTTLNTGGSTSTGTQSACNSAILASGFDAGSSGTGTTVDEAGNVVSTESGAAGISTIPTANLVNPNSATGTTVAGVSNGTYTITGLQNGVTYTVVVAAVDGSGNVGLASGEACDYPAPVDDFWKIYREAGGQAGGGFCALEAVGAPAGSSLALLGLGASAVAVVRRRRRRS
jgi:hypothetical protein